MSYYGGPSEKPDCFADDSEYDERSSGCRGCGFRLECAKALEEKAKMSYYRQRPSATTTTTYSTSTTPARTTTYQTAPTASTQKNGVIRAADVDFNFNKPLFKQFTSYLALDIAQVTTERLHSFITASRENYRQSVMRGDIDED
jgi:hypothetical protein